MNQVVELRSMYDSIESTIRNLKMLNVDSDTYGCFLSPLLPAVFHRRIVVAEGDPRGVQDVRAGFPSTSIFAVKSWS